MSPTIEERLRDVAEEMRLAPHIPPSVLRRARRRRARTALVAAVVAAGVVAGGIVGVRSVTGDASAPNVVRPADPGPIRGERNGTDLPAAVNETRRAIVSAAEGRDWDALERLIPERGFTYSIGDSVGGGAEAVRFWQELEASGDPILQTLVTYLDGPWTVVRPGLGVGGAVTYRGEVIHQWPAASAKPPKEWTAEDVAQLRQVATAEEIRDFRRHGYFGYRVGIAADGTWLFYVAGD